MSKKSQTDEPSNLVKFISLSIIGLLFVVGIFVVGKLSGSDSSQNNGGCYSAKSSFCTESEPEPNYELTDEQLRNQPDATQYDHSDDCGGYSCKQLEQEAQEEMEQTDREIDQALREQGIQ